MKQLLLHGYKSLTLLAIGRLLAMIFQVYTNI